MNAVFDSNATAAGGLDLAGKSYLLYFLIFLFRSKSATFAFVFSN